MCKCVSMCNYICTSTLRLKFINVAQMHNCARCAQLCKVCTKCVAQKFPNLVAGSTILSTIGQVSFSHPRDPLLRNSIKEISFFLRGRKYRGNIVPNLQSSDPWPTSSDAGPYLHRESIGEMGGRGGGGPGGGRWHLGTKPYVCSMVCCQSD